MWILFFAIKHQIEYHNIMGRGNIWINFAGIITLLHREHITVIHQMATPSLLISIKRASETFKIWLIYITISLYSFFTYNGYFIIIIQFIAYICRVECNNLSMHTTECRRYAVSEHVYYIAKGTTTPLSSTGFVSV